VERQYMTMIPQDDKDTLLSGAKSMSCTSSFFFTVLLQAVSIGAVLLPTLEFRLI
jgi:hypothetical protein